MAHELHRTLNFRDLTLLVIGTVIGSGIFLVPGSVLTQVQGRVWPALAAWTIGGVLSLLGALTYGELTAANPKAGGLYVFLRDCFGTFPAFLFGWALFFAIGGGANATLAAGFSRNLAQVIPMSPLAAKVVAVVVLAGVTIVNVRGTRDSANLQNGTTLIKVAVLVGMSALFLLFGRNLSAPTVNATNSAGLWSGFGLAMIGVLWAYEGWQYATFSAGETIDPQRNFPRAFLLGLAALIGIYLLANVAYLAVLGPAGTAASRSAAAASLAVVVGPNAAKLVALAIAISILGALNGAILTASRVYYAMARDGVFFQKLAEVHPRFGTPAFAVVAGCAWSAVLAVTGTFEQLFTYTVFTGWLFYGLAASTIFIYRRTHVEARPYSVPFYPWTPLLFIVAAVALVAVTVIGQPRTAIVGLVIVLLGAPAYLIWRGRKVAGRFRIAFLIILIATTAHAAQPVPAGFDDFVNDALRKWDVPGLSLAVVVDGKVILAKGYGERDVENKSAMTPDTLLAIGSCTKAFTTFVMGQLVDEGKLDWDKPVRDYLPGFRMATPELTEELTVRDLVSHRSGVPRHDLSWYNNQELSRRELVARLGSLPPNAELRARYQYNNLMFLTAGYLVEQLTKMTWEEAVRQRIFKPLGMNRSNFSDADSQKDPDHAKPYRWDSDSEKLIAIPYRELGNMGPAGSINSSANEMSRWLLVQLSRGKFDGRQMINAATLREIHTPQVTMGLVPDQPEVSPPSYAMGWVVDSYRGHARVWHTGGIDGFSALVTLYPNDGIGVVALANATGTPLHTLVRDHLVDRLLDLPQKDWSGEALARRAVARKAAKEARTKRAAVRKSGTTPSHSLDDYVGQYENGGYGILTIGKTDQGALQATYNHIVTPLEHWHYDVFNGLKNEKDPVFEDMKYNFRSDVAGNVFAVEAAFEPAVPPIVFRKKPDARLSDPSFLAPFSGDYTMGAQKVVVSLRGSQLFLSIGNQQPRVLEPDIDGWFNVKGLSDVRVRLQPDRIEISEPEGVFTATRAIKSPS